MLLLGLPSTFPSRSLTFSMLLLLLSLGWLSTATSSDRQNVLLICVDDLRPELHCYGVEYIHSPNIDRLAAEGRLFKRHYVQAPTCGASRCALLTGRYGGSSNAALFQRASALAAGQKIPPSLPAWFRQNGYTAVSVGKVSHHPGGLGGPDWDDESQVEMPESWDRHLLEAGPWQHPRGFMHGLAHGEIRVNARDMDVYQSIAGEDTIYPDGLTMKTALREMTALASDESRPFFLAVGLLRPHLPFGAPAKYMEHYRNVQLPAIPHPEKPSGRTTWHRSGEFMKYNRWQRDPNQDSDFAEEVRKHYAACVSYADAQVGRLMRHLQEIGVWDNTIVILWGDHGWHLGEHAIWGKHSLFEESLQSPLIIRHHAMEQAGAPTEAMVESIDVFPTLCELIGIPIPEALQGISLVPMLKNPSTAGHPAISYAGKARTIRTNRYRLITHNDGYQELYDHTGDSPETRNVATQSQDAVRNLLQLLDARRPGS